MKKKLLAVIIGVVVLTAGIAFSLTWNGQVLTLINASTVTGDGPVKNLIRPYQRHTWQVVTTGSPSSVSVTLQGSLDNSLWTVLDTSTTTTSEKRHVASMPTLYIKANVGTLSGGTNPTVTVKSIHLD